MTSSDRNYKGHYVVTSCGTSLLANANRKLVKDFEKPIESLLKKYANSKEQDIEKKI